jgi:hypothetical protein
MFLETRSLQRCELLEQPGEFLLLFPLPRLASGCRAYAKALRSGNEPLYPDRRFSSPARCQVLPAR